MSIIPSLIEVFPGSFNPRPPKRTLCPVLSVTLDAANQFQSTSSEDDVVSVKHDDINH